MLNRSPRTEALFWSAWIAAASVFVGLAIWSRNEYYLPGDRRVTFAVQDLYTQPWADNFFDYANHAGDEWVLGLILGVLTVVLALRRFFAEAALVVAAGLSQFIAVAAGAAAQRPDIEYRTMRSLFEGLRHPRIYPSPDGFPSGHVYGEVLVYGLVLLLVPRLLPWRPLAAAVQCACVAIIAAGFVAPMYLGAHWFSDCIAGAILALLVFAVLWRIDAFAHRNRALVRVEDLIDRRATASPTVVQAGRPLRTR